MVRRDFRLNTFWLTAVLAVFCVGLLIAAGLALISRFDAVSKAREQSVVTNGLAGREAEIARMALPQIIWDDAVRNLDNRFDGAWAEKNIGIYLSEGSGFDYSFVLDARNRPVFSFAGSSRAEIGRFDHFAAETVYSSTR